MKLFIKTKEDLESEKKAQEQAEIRKEALDYLSKTDWYATRLAETGKPIPDDIKQKRAELRELLSNSNDLL